MTTSSSGFIGSVTHACRMCVVIGSGTPAMSLMSVLQPAVQLRTWPALIVPRFVRTVSNAWHEIPTGEQTRTAIFTSNYGEASALDVLRTGLRLPRHYSGHNGFSEWGIPPLSDTYAMLIGFNSPQDAASSFDRCRTLAVVTDGVGLTNQEQGIPGMLCRTTAPWTKLWPHLRPYD